MVFLILFLRYFPEILKKNVGGSDDIRKDLPKNLIQIDDWYQKEVGDWCDFNEKFPSGVETLANKIHNNGFAPGIWLALFVVHPRSELARDYLEWLLRKKNKRLARAGEDPDILSITY